MNISVVVSGAVLENSVVVGPGSVTVEIAATVVSVIAMVPEESVDVMGKLNEDENVCAAKMFGYKISKSDV